jgi:hypothetical protein
MLGEARRKSEVSRGRSVFSPQKGAFRHPHAVDERDEALAEKSPKKSMTSFVPSSVASRAK